MMYGWDFDDLEPHTNGMTYGSGDEMRARWRAVGYTGISQDPMLVVEHSAGGGGGGGSTAFSQAVIIA